MSEARPQLQAFQLFRQGPAPGEIGCAGSCPLCNVAGERAGTYPPCLACRDELRARMLETIPAAMPGAVWN